MNEEEVLRMFPGAERVQEYMRREHNRILTAEEIFMCHLYAFPLMATAERYRRLGANNYQCNRVRSTLLSQGLITTEEEVIGMGRVKRLVPTKAGFAWLKERDLNGGNPRTGGTEHQYWKRRLVARFQAEGFSAQMEKQLGANRALDVYVKSGKRGVGVEVETGNNRTRQLEENLKKYPRVVVLYLGKRDIGFDAARTERECVERVKKMLTG